MKNFSQNLALTIFAVIFSLVGAEIALRLDGRYHDLASRELIPSPAIWEPIANQIEYVKHPDLGVPLEIRYDKDGVRNHSEPSTSEKRNIVGFFGDSFTENRRVENRYSFTSILDGAARPGARVVNYGVDGYGLDQSYLRYKKYERHDIQHVVYVFCENDLRNLYETGLTEVTQNGNIAFVPAKDNHLYRLIGRLHVTYLTISAYYQARALFNAKWKWKRVGPVKWGANHGLHRARFEDQYASLITMNFLSPAPSLATSQLSRKFLLLLEKWKHEVEISNRTFSILVLPWKINDEVAAKLFHRFDGTVVYSNAYFENCQNCIFQNDGHWNEHGNELIAQFILSNSAFPFRELFKIIETTKLNSEINEYYTKLAR